jgi:hypothetical protein
MNADLNRHAGANIYYKKRSCFSLFASFAVKSADNLFPFLYIFLGARTCSRNSLKKSRDGAPPCFISAPGFRPQHHDAPGIQPGKHAGEQARPCAPEIKPFDVRRGLHKKRVSASLIRRFAQMWNHNPAQIYVVKSVPALRSGMKKISNEPNELDKNSRHPSSF